MAVLKHIASCNARYSDSLNYLKYQHNEFSCTPILDEQGKMILRDELLIDCLNVENIQMFVPDCIVTNETYGKNNQKNEIKSHHYIISFDPKDVTDNGLTMSMAQEIGMDFAIKNFPGHQALVATHADGHNHSGNIHVHIVINSVRKFDVERQEFMERPSDCKAGCKHHVTNSFLAYLKKDLMETCKEHGLYQVDLLSPSRNKITEKEYWKTRREKASGNKEFKTDLEFLREKVAASYSKAKSFKEFKDTLFYEYGISLSESRGRISYLLPDKSKPVTGRRLGTDYDKDYITTRVAENNKLIIKKSEGITPLIDVANNEKAKDSIYYRRALELKNIETLAKMANLLTKEHISSVEDMEAIVAAKEDKYNDVLAKNKAVNKQIKLLNAQIRYTGQYWANKATYEEYLKVPDNRKERFYEANRSSIVLFETARKELKEMTKGGKLPTVKALKEQKATLQAKENELYEIYGEAKKQYLEACTMLDNLKKTLHGIEEPEEKRSKQRDELS